MPQRVKTKKQDLSNEVVVGGRSFFNTPQNNATPDRVETRLNSAMIDRLRLDAEVESDVSFLFDAVFADGMEPVPCITDEDDPEFEDAKGIAEFVKQATDTRRPMATTVKEMAKSAFYSGVKVAEIVLRYDDSARIGGKLVLDRINPKPNSATAFVTDKFYNVLGLVGAKNSGQPVVSVAAVQLTDEEIIPREKFLIIDFEIEDNDPRALSQVRAIVGEYCEKTLTREQWKEWRRTSAIPKKVGITAPGAKAVMITDSNGSPIVENGVQKTITAQKALMNGLEGFANNSAIAVENGADIKQLEVTGTGVQFERAIRYNDAKIRKVILGDSLVTAEADKDARAARESSKDVSDIRKQALRVVIQNAVKKDIYRLLTVLNFGEEKAHLTPDCFLGDTEANDWAGDLQAAAGAGYTFAPEHFAQLDKQFGLEPRSQEPERAVAQNSASTEGGDQSTEENV